MGIAAEGRARAGAFTGGRATLAGAALLAGALALTGCGSGGEGKTPESRSRAVGHEKQDATRLPGIGDRMHERIPDSSRQVLTVRGQGPNSARSRVDLYVREGNEWKRDRGWGAHNGRKGWTPDHRLDDLRSPVGVFSLSDAGGVRADPGSSLPYTRSAAFTPPSFWPEEKQDDFDHVIAVDYNRVKGSAPTDQRRPQGAEKGGGIWLHLDHGYGTSGCVSLPRSGIRHLLKTLDPAKHPTVVMGDKASLAR